MGAAADSGDLIAGYFSVQERDERLIFGPIFGLILGQGVDEVGSEPLSMF